MHSQTCASRRRCTFFCSLLIVSALTACAPSSSTPVSHDIDAQVDQPLLDAGEPEPFDAATSGRDAFDRGVDAGTDGAADAHVDAHTTRPDAPIVCGTHDPLECPTPPVRYSDVQPIFARRCVLCHSPLWTGPWPLDAYQHVADWQDDIRADMLACSMPMPDAGVPITLEERQQILSFIRCGLPM